ncbi:MAG TPA: hypothetical protein DDW52_02795 [Planctomycetaceae bacterium]|nr:hypothetical protein [Planctomycetaceae bacterium]
MMKSAGANEVYERMQESSSAIKYAVGAMQPIDPNYTANTYGEGDRVKNQLDKNLKPAGIVCDFEYQGSVTNHTHIKAKSDIDLLTLHCRFVGIEPPQPNTSPYQGNPVADLLQLRRSSVSILEAKFPEATVDASGSKSVCIEGGSLRRKIDVVVSNWWDTNDYARTRQKKDRGVEILDAHELKRISNLPFLHNDRIETKDAMTLGGMRKAARLLKSLKYDAAQEVSLSSYDIAALAYTMDNQKLIVMKGQELQLVMNCKEHLDHVAGNSLYRSSLEVPNGTRKIFCAGGATVAKLDELRRELDGLVYDITNDLSRSFRKLASARVDY